MQQVEDRPGPGDRRVVGEDDVERRRLPQRLAEVVDRGEGHRSVPRRVGSIEGRRSVVARSRPIPTRLAPGVGPGRRGPGARSRSTRWSTALVIGRLASGKARARSRSRASGPFRTAASGRGLVGGPAGEEIAGVVEHRRAGRRPGRRRGTGAPCAGRRRRPCTGRRSSRRRRTSRTAAGPGRSTTSAARRRPAWARGRPRAGGPVVPASRVSSPSRRWVTITDRRGRGRSGPARSVPLSSGIDVLGLDVDRLAQLVPGRPSAPGTSSITPAASCLTPCRQASGQGPSAKRDRR